MTHSELVRQLQSAARDWLSTSGNLAALLNEAALALAAAQEDGEIGRAVNRAARELPEGYELSIELERGAGTVRLYPHKGEPMHDFEAETFSGQINQAIDAARAKGGEG
jgi:hypothetical protein